jgi:alkylation response protein AidB-like acyl-CoA dehydrogenase
MSHFKSNVRDIAFNLFEVFNTQDYLGEGRYAHMPADTARMLLEEVDRFSRESIWADSFVPADRTPLELDDDGNITVPEELHQALQAFYAAGWHTISLPQELGGGDIPPSLRWLTAELFFGGHATAMLWPIGSLMGAIVYEEGTEGQKTIFAQNMVDKQWGGTMVLTEPDAGSDVGAGVTSAVKVEDNGPDDMGSVWHLEGVKRFITSADYQGHENTVHLVLARPKGGIGGTKGLRLFIVPKYLVNPDGSLGARNGVKVTNIEKKMGIKGSATCELTMGADADMPCVGYLVGEKDNDGDGIRQMFRVIEYARMSVGTKAMATLSTGYLNALEYAKIRVQGPDMTQMLDADPAKVTIINHPDVRRLLMEQKAHAEGMRALVAFTGWVQDQAELAHDDPEAHKDWIKREDFLLPLVKGYCSEKAYELLGSASLQTFGGSGFTQDYPIEQYIRDAKIDTLYEGTTAIQSLDLFFRKIARDQGATLLWFAGQINQFVESRPRPPWRRTQGTGRGAGGRAGPPGHARPAGHGRHGRRIRARRAVQDRAALRGPAELAVGTRDRLAAPAPGPGRPGGPGRWRDRRRRGLLHREAGLRPILCRGRASQGASAPRACRSRGRRPDGCPRRCLLSVRTTRLVHRPDGPGPAAVVGRAAVV